MNKIVILGGASVDLIGVASEPLRMKDSNPGVVRLSYGGVGRNIAENIARLNKEVTLISVFGNDILGHLCFDANTKVGIDVSHSIFVDGPTAAYLAILDSDGDMALGVSDNSILAQLKFDQCEKVLAAMHEADVLVLESNLDSLLIEQVLYRKKTKVACDPISTRKAEKFKSHLHQIDIFKPNVLEAQIYTGFQLKNDADFLKALHFFREKGIEEIIISAADQGIYVSNHASYFHLRAPAIQALNATGAGDAFMGAYLVYRQSEPFQKALEYAMVAAMLTLRSETTVLQDLHPEQIIKYHETLKFVRRDLC